MSSKRNYFKMAYGIEEVESVEYIHDDEIDASLATSEGEADAILSDINVTSDTADTLDNDLETVEVIEDTVNNPEGIDTQTALVVQETLESIYRRHGLSRYKPYKYSQEDFDIAGSANKIGKSIKENVTAIKNKITQGLSNITDKCKNLFDGFIEKKSKVVQLVEKKSSQALGILKSGGEWSGDKANSVISFLKGGKEKSSGGSISGSKFINALSMCLSNVVSTFKSDISTAFTRFKDRLTKPGYETAKDDAIRFAKDMNGILKGAGSIITGAKDDLLSAIEGANKIMKQAMNAISDFSKSTFDTLKGVGDKSKANAKDSGGGNVLTKAVNGTGNFIKSTATSACNALSDIIDMCATFIKNASSKAKSLVSSKGK